MRIPESILAQIRSIHSWSEWDEIREKVFKESRWVVTSAEQMELDLSRDVKIVDGVAWEPCTQPYQQDADTVDLYEDVRAYVFEKLEPEAALQNKEHPHRYGKVCNSCKLWSKSYKNENCPFCGRFLHSMPLNID